MQGEWAVMLLLCWTASAALLLLSGVAFALSGFFNEILEAPRGSCLPGVAKVLSAAVAILGLVLLPLPWLIALLAG